MNLAIDVESQQSKKRTCWIDCARAVAIFAVITDHCYGILYSNRMIAYASYFSASLFVMLSGVSIWAAVQNGKELSFQKQIRKVLKMFIQYALATLVVLVSSTCFFDLRTYISWTINFSALPPYYYFVFFFQLLLISPILVGWCQFCNRQGKKIIWHLSTLGFLGFISFVSIHYSHILPVHGGGAKPFWRDIFIDLLFGNDFCEYGLLTFKKL